MKTIKMIAFGLFITLIGTQCFGAEVNPKKLELNRELMDAVMDDRYHDIVTYATEGADIDGDGVNMTPLMLAAIKGHLKSVRKLLELKANIEAQDGIGNTALMQAAREASNKVVKILLANNAHVNAQNQNNWTALMYAAQAAGLVPNQRANDKYYNTIQELVNGGADLSLTNNQGETALDMARRFNINDERILDLLTMGG